MEGGEKDEVREPQKEMSYQKFSPLPPLIKDPPKEDNLPTKDNPLHVSLYKIASEIRR